MHELSALERAAFLILLKRQPLFKWEREALTDTAMRSLEHKGLVARAGQRWQVTEQGQTAATRWTKSKRP
ncbi:MULTISPECIES: hypothetical protein [Lysobacter]|jgi:hypothetical protein|uniref:Uncharacterized protein n=1 Tax=Lysobacter gummosus TaxID=262324 RepID=A0ABY3XJR8_9GAMM|nr:MULTISPECIES: hypothetical protein [Lysobacter]ALN91500.1 hypothetical protein LG3211_2533 [Lysobacter gummosus]UJB21483.1 hypothetical protein L1A79_10705 [Lysobacter capsici]UJQ29400.1 hypothetical protein L2D09_04160 [Lysobacter gummosus]UNP31867.1 hypothetical protein MOV92_11700 [Lysobacter gummosus]